MSSSDALLREGKVIDKLYDSESMMSISRSVAEGFVVLLGGIEQAKGGKDISLAFMALVQGNVMDACFGVENPSRRDETPATRSAGDAKHLMEECAQADDNFRAKATSAYCDAFRVIATYRKEYEKLNCITRCFRAKPLYDKSEKELREAFLGLAQVVAEQQ